MMHHSREMHLCNDAPLRRTAPLQWCTTHAKCTFAMMHPSREMHLCNDAPLTRDAPLQWCTTQAKSTFALMHHSRGMHLLHEIQNSQGMHSTFHIEQSTKYFNSWEEWLQSTGYIFHIDQEIEHSKYCFNNWIVAWVNMTLFDWLYFIFPSNNEESFQHNVTMQSSKENTVDLILNWVHLISMPHSISFMFLNIVVLSVGALIYNSAIVYFQKTNPFVEQLDINIENELVLPRPARQSDSIPGDQLQFLVLQQQRECHFSARWTRSEHRRWSIRPSVLEAVPGGHWKCLPLPDVRPRNLHHNRGFHRNHRQSDGHLDILHVSFQVADHNHLLLYEQRRFKEVW